MSLKSLLHSHAMNPNDPSANWALALHYDDLGQTASAISFYLRTAERTENGLLQYTCLLRAALCFARQGTRGFTVKGLLQHAIALQPRRPEAYFLLSRYYERETYDGHWQDCYTIASIGEAVGYPVARIDQEDMPPLPAPVDYPQYHYGLKFEKAVSSWWCGLCEESKALFEELLLYHPLDPVHYAATFHNLKMLGSPLAQWQPFEIYTGDQHNLLRLEFRGSTTIQRNYSEAFQDMFVLSVLDGKVDGRYLEIGAGHPIYGNNTFLLHSEYGWKGISVDIDPKLESLFSKLRYRRRGAFSAKRGHNPLTIRDATDPMFWKDMEVMAIDKLGCDILEPLEIDYLQLDCDPPSTTFEILRNCDFTRWKFAVISYEHDQYADPQSPYQELSRQLLESHGYLRVVCNVAPDNHRAYEDWWVHPDLVDLGRVMLIAKPDTSVKSGKSVLLR